MLFGLINLITLPISRRILIAQVLRFGSRQRERLTVLFALWVLEVRLVGSQIFCARKIRILPLLLLILMAQRSMLTIRRGF